MLYEVITDPEDPQGRHDKDEAGADGVVGPHHRLALARGLRGP